MRRSRWAILGGLMILALVVQTSLFSKVSVVTPDLVLLLVILLALTRASPEMTLVVAFVAGVTVDLASFSLLGLRSVVYLAVAYLAVRTRGRADVGRFLMSVWVGVLTLLGTIVTVVVGTLFGQTSLVGANTPSRIFLIPVANLVVAALVAPWVLRLIDPDRGSVRF